jgi:DNA invertase Pin-like site-specific DNA recombinase
MQNVYGYIRVSGKKQEDGASLPEQKRIIQEYAKTNNLNIIHFYEETKTAAKRGRPFFTQMLENLKQDKAQGVIMHKIDRSARNLHDWAAIGDLIDNNIAVYFAHESLNLHERGGRLSADIQAVMASDYVRNLRQETLKGVYGRLKEGIFPFPAPVGYQNNGKGKVKTICSTQGKLIKMLFMLYKTEKYNFDELSKEMEKRGLRNLKGKKVCKNGISRILNNPFYIGLIKIRGQTFEGKHDPLIDTRTFKQVQMIIRGRNNKGKVIKHNYLFRKLLKCQFCNNTLIGEKQKGILYYRCQIKGCPMKCIREDYVERYVKNGLMTISISKKEFSTMSELLIERKKNWKSQQEKFLKSIDLNIAQIESRENKLLDAFLDNLIEKESYEARKQSLLIEKREAQERKEHISNAQDAIYEEIRKTLELCYNLLKFYNSAILEEKRELVKNITSNLTIQGKSVTFKMFTPYEELRNRDILTFGAPQRDNQQTMTSQITYTDKNTSGITPKPLNKKQAEQFVDILFSNISSLSIPNLENNHAIRKDHPSTQ